MFGAMLASRPERDKLLGFADVARSYASPSRRDDSEEPSLAGERRRGEEWRRAEEEGGG